jgi:hypothetical protein
MVSENEIDVLVFSFEAGKVLLEGKVIYMWRLGQILSTYTFWMEPSNDHHSVDIFQISTTKLSSRFQKPNTHFIYIHFKDSCAGYYSSQHTFFV